MLHCPFQSPNLETKPREKMFRITTKYPEDPRAPFYNADSDEMLPLARLYLHRDSVTPGSCDDSLLKELALETAENTEDTARRKTVWLTCLRLDDVPD